MKTSSLSRLLTPLALLAVTTPALAGKDDCASFNLRVRFTIASPACANTGSTSCEAIRSWLRTEVAEAERLFSDRPSLRITPEYAYATSRAGKDLTHVSFASDGEYNRYMQDNFDNVATSKTTGYMQVLVSQSLTIDGKNWGGISGFPHDTDFNWFGSKHGLIIVNETGYFSRCSLPSRALFAHELGHALGLLHTFDTYVGGRACNVDYAKVMGDSVRGSRINVMDYELDGPTCPRERYANECQQDVAKDTRVRYLTNDCAVNYNDVTGKGIF